MLEPGAMGTLLIGLSLVDEANARHDRASRRVAVPRRKSSTRAALARGLRRVASALERPTVGEATEA